FARKSPLFNRSPRKNRKNPQKTCGNQRKPIDKLRRKADCELRYVFPHPHQHWRFRDSHPRARAPDLNDGRREPAPHCTTKRSNTMAKGMTKTQLVRTMAEKLEITNKQSAAGLELLADLAVKETKKNGEFTIPGIGKLVKAERKARMGRNPQTGEPIKIKAKTVVKFRVAKVAKDTIAPPKK